MAENYTNSGCFSGAVVVGLMGIWGGASWLPTINAQLTEIRDELKNYPRIQSFHENTMGNPKIPEEYYVINGQEVYLSIDGMSVQDYFKNIKDKKMRR